MAQSALSPKQAWIDVLGKVRKSCICPAVLQRPMGANLPEVEGGQGQSQASHTSPDSSETPWWQ